MFAPKKDHPDWLLRVYPYLFFLRYDRKMFFKALTGRMQFHWHYSWESELRQKVAEEHPDFNYKPGSFILPDSRGDDE